MTSSRIDAGLVALCAAAAALTAVLAAPMLLGDGDLYWRIASGRWMLENQAVLRIDMFSATYAGQPWQAQDWLSDVALALAYIGAGWGAVQAVTAAAAALSAGLAGYFLARVLNGGVTVVVLALAFAVGAGALSASPDILALPLFIIWCAGLAKARADNRTPSFALLAAMPLWANLDTSYLAGLVLAAVMGIEAVIAARGARLATARGWAVFAGFALLLSLITPYGIEGFGQAIRHVQLPHSGDVRSALPLLLAIPAVALIVHSRAVPVRLVFLAGLFALSLYLKSAELLLAFAVPLLLSHMAATLLQQTPMPSGMKLRPAAAFVVIAAGALLLRLWLPLERHDEVGSPQSALAKVPAPLARRAVLNDIAFGGFLIFNDVRPYIDSRPLYSRSFRDRYQRMTGSDSTALAITLDRRHIRWTIFTPGSPAVAAMDGLKDWHRLHGDQWAVVHVRNE